MNEHIFIAAAGALIYNVLQFLEVLSKPRASQPDFKSWLYWLPYAIWPVLGGFLAYVYQTPTTPLSKFVSFHIGLSSPLILRQMVQSLPIVPNKIPLKDDDQ